MPNREQFKTQEEYLEWYRDYRKKNRKKIRKYNKVYNKEWNKENGYDSQRKWDKNNPEKVKAHRILRYALRTGMIKKGVCEVCGKEKVHGHHDDYSKPLEVKWFCSRHHREYHLKKKGL